MIVYLLKSTLCLSLLLAFYHLVLEHEKMHRFNRFYLLGSILFSFLVPLFIIYITVPTETITNQIFKENSNIQNSKLVTESTISYLNYFLITSILISTLLLFRFLKNLFSIIQKIKKNKCIKHQKSVFVLVNNQILPHTFWNYIFINKTQFETNKIEKELFTHEITHATQKHTFDVILIEVLKIIFWFNPIFYFLKRSIQLNHEFLADNQVISSHKNIFEYQHLLLNKTTSNNEYYLASNLNYSLTKKRLQMMTISSSPTKILLKKLTVFPLLIGFLFLFAQRINAQEKATPTVVSEYNTLAKKYNNKSNNRRILKKDVKRIQYLYAKLNNKQKNNAERFPSFPPPPPHPIKNGNLNTPPSPTNSRMVKKGEKSNIPPPPHLAKTALEYIQRINNPDISYFYNNKKITYKEACKIVKKEPKINMSTHIDNNVGTIHFSSIK